MQPPMASPGEPPAGADPAAGDVRSLLVHPVLWPRVAAWVAAQGLILTRYPGEPDDLETWAITPSAAAMRAATGP